MSKGIKSIAMGLIRIKQNKKKEIEESIIKCLFLEIKISDNVKWKSEYKLYKHTHSHLKKKPTAYIKTKQYGNKC